MSTPNWVARRLHQKKCASGAVKWSKKYSRPAQHIVGDPEVLEQAFRGELDHAFGRASRVADFGRVVDPAQIGVDLSLIHI